jgi:Uma2 family endonuclease
MVEAGILGPDDRVELLEGEILELSPEKSRHAAAVDLAAEVLRRAFGPGHTIRVQHPLALGDASEPELDVAIVTGSPRDYAEAHPTTAVLVVEVSDTSLEYDRRRKAALYARSGIAEYWVVNLVDRCLEVHRDAVASGYRGAVALDAGATVAPVAAPAFHVAVADLLP